MHVRSRDIWATAGLHMPILSNPLHTSDFQNFPVKNHGKTLFVSTLRKGICFLKTEKKNNVASYAAMASSQYH